MRWWCWRTEDVLCIGISPPRRGGRKIARRFFGPGGKLRVSPHPKSPRCARRFRPPLRGGKTPKKKKRTSPSRNPLRSGGSADADGLFTARPTNTFAFTSVDLADGSALSLCSEDVAISCSRWVARAPPEVLPLLPASASLGHFWAFLWFLSGKYVTNSCIQETGRGLFLTDCHFRGRYAVGGSPAAQLRHGIMAAGTTGNDRAQRH
jgi:hypothetical protein